jgi:replicative DNA helicase
MLEWDAAVDQAVGVGLAADDFFRPEHRPIFTTICELRATGNAHGPIDVRIEIEALADRKAALDHVGGANYLVRLVEAQGMLEWVATDANRILELGRRRRLMDTALQAHYLAADPAVSLEQVASTLATAGHTEVSVHERAVDGATFALDAPAIPPALWGAEYEIAWAEGEALMLVGPQGVGKTTLAGRLILHRIGLADGDLLGMPVAVSGGRVLYLACDRPSQVRRSMRRMVEEKDRPVLAERLQVWQGPPPADFAREPGLLTEMCRRYGADTVVIDSLKDVVAELSKDEAGSGYNRARQLALAQGIQVLELHHQRKPNDGNKRPKSINEVYGSIWLTAGVGSVLLLWGDPGDAVVELSHLKQPVEEIGPLSLLHDATTGLITIARGVDLLELLRNLVDTDARAGLDEVGQPAATVARHLFSIEGRAPEPRETEKARRKLEALVRKGLAISKPGAAGGHRKRPTLYYPAAAPSGDRPP